MEAEQIREALALLKDPKVNERPLWLHDFDATCYRSQKGYTRNGLHWGYAEGIVSSITGRDTCGHAGTSYAFFEDDCFARNAEGIRSNSRYSKHSYAEVREIIEKTLHEDLEAATAREAANQKVIAEWHEEAAAKWPQHAGRTMRMELSEGRFRLIVLKPERLARRGFGWFLEDIKAGEVSCSPGALEWLRKGRERRGLNNLEISAVPLIAGMLTLDTQFKRDDVSIQDGALAVLEPLFAMD